MKSFKMLSNQNSRLRTGWGPAYGPGVLGGCHEPLTPSPSHSQLRTQTMKLWVQMTQWSRQSPSILPSALPRASTSREHGQHTLPPKLAWRLVPAAPASSSSRSLTWSWRGPPLLGSISPARNHCHGLEETPTDSAFPQAPPPSLLHRLLREPWAPDSALFKHYPLELCSDPPRKLRPGSLKTTRRRAAPLPWTKPQNTESQRDLYLIEGLMYWGLLLTAGSPPRLTSQAEVRPWSVCRMPRNDDAWPKLEES